MQKMRRQAAEEKILLPDEMSWKIFAHIKWRCDKKEHGTVCHGHALCFAVAGQLAEKWRFGSVGLWLCWHLSECLLDQDRWSGLRFHSFR